MIEFERSDMEHYAYMYLSTNFPGAELHMTYTQVSATECVVEYPENNRVIIKFTEDLMTAEVIDYPYVN